MYVEQNINLMSPDDPNDFLYLLLIKSHAPVNFHYFYAQFGHAYVALSS